MINTIGKTPLIKLKTNKNIFCKFEKFNPLSSIKDRTALYLMRSAKNAKTIIEATSGNTGIALASLGAIENKKVILTMPETMSIERQKLLKFLGATLILTPAKEGMQGAVNKAKELAKTEDNAVFVDQFSNPSNPLAHYETTGPEIYEQTKGDIDIFVCAVGTGGTISGTAKFLKEKNKNIKVVAVEPANSAVLSGGKAGAHKIQGIGAGFIPPILRHDLIDEIITITDDEAFTATNFLARVEGLFCGISSGSAYIASEKLALRKENYNKKIVFIAPDSGDRYLSIL